MPRPEESREAAAHAAAHAAHDYGSGSSGAVTGGSNTWLVGGDWTMNGGFFQKELGRIIIPIDFYSYFSEGLVYHQPAGVFKDLNLW